MAPRRSRTLTDAELEIMQVLWNHDEVLVEDVEQAFQDAGAPLAPSSIRTMLGILQKKGYVRRRRFGRGHAYRATVPEDQARKRILNDVITRVFDGSATDLVATLMSHGMVGQDELKAARKLIRKYEKERER